MVIALVTGVLAPVAVSVVAPTAAFAANLVVASTADSGPNTLRQAVLNASSGDVITFQFGLGPVVLTSGEIVLNKDLTIRGNGAANTVITRGGVEPPAFRIFSVASPVTANIDMVTISNGFDTSGDGGGGIFNDGTLNLSRSTVTGNRAQLFSEGDARGGGIVNFGTAVITNTEVVGNSVPATPNSATGRGGGIDNEGTMSLSNSSVSNNSVTSVFGSQGGGIANVNGGALTLRDALVSGNTATVTGVDDDARGGGIAHDFGDSLSITNGIIRGNHVVAGATSGIGEGAGLFLHAGATIDRSEISGNTIDGGATREGGGLYVFSGQLSFTVSVTNTTVANNAAATSGGALYNGVIGATVNLSSVTVAGNTSSGPAIDNDAGLVTEKNTIVNNPGSAANCSGPIGDLLNNLQFPAGGCPGVVTDPGLGALGDHGGITQTMVPTVVDGGAGCPAVDQRSYTRTGTCDIGAYDVGGVLPDTAPPTCGVIALFVENPKKQRVAAVDPGRGIQGFTNITVSNGIVVQPFFLPRTNLPVDLTAVKVNQAALTIWHFNVFDQVNNTKQCI